MNKSQIKIPGQFTFPMSSIICDDILRYCNGLKPQYHALLTDPPYGLGFGELAWDRENIIFQSRTWEILGNLLLPGALGITFVESRTWHRIAVAIEDAGFILHTSIFLWANGQGWSKHRKSEKYPSWSYGRATLRPAVEPIIIRNYPLTVGG